MNDCRILALKWKGVKKKRQGRGERATPTASNDEFRRLEKMLRFKGRVRLSNAEKYRVRRGWGRVGGGGMETRDGWSYTELQMEKGQTLCR